MKFIIFSFFILSLERCTQSLHLHQLHEYEHHEHKKPIPILKQEFEQHHEGYKYSYETANGIHAHETGYFKNKGDKKHETLVQKGTITYHDEHGHPITLTYIADEHGFQPQGAHLPTPPPIPAEIAKALHEDSHQHHSLSLGEQELSLSLGEDQQDYGHY